MAQNFKIPSEYSTGRVVNEPVTSRQEPPTNGPKFVGYGKYLREKNTGIIHNWNEVMANRSDLVELVEDDAALNPSDDLSALVVRNDPALPTANSRF